MKVSTENLGNRQQALTIEAESAEIEDSLRKAYLHLGQRLNIPGFRKGKTPPAILERYIGKERIREESVRVLLSQLYPKALQEQKIEPLGEPEMEVIQQDPLKFKLTVSLFPLVELGDYRQVRIVSEKIEVSSEDVESVMGRFREQLAPWEPVERTAGIGDMVIADVENKSGDKPQADTGEGVYYVTPGSRQLLPGFVEELIGLGKGEEKEVKLSYPDEYEDKTLAGKEYRFRVKVKEIKEKHLPELNDELAKNAGQGVETLAALREKIAVELRAVADRVARRNLAEKAVRAVAELSRIEFPPIVVKQEIDSLLTEQTVSFGEGAEGLKNYLRYINKTEEEVREELRPQAEKLLTYSLLLDKLTVAENIQVTEAEVDAEIEKMARSRGEKVEELMKRFSSPGQRLSLRHWLLQNKASQCLAEIVTSATPEEIKTKEEESPEEALNKEGENERIS